MKRIYLLDGTSNLFRAFYAIRGLTNSSGKPTNATFGFTQMLRKLLTDEKPEYLAVVFDRPEPTHRHQVYPQYKANRMAPPEALVVQIPDTKEACRVLGIPVVERAGYEADDLIGTLARKAAADGFQVVVVSSDKDLLQLVDDSTRVLHPVKGELLDREGVRASFGVYPKQVVEVLALMGDSSDNIPGVPGIGEKGARELIARYGHLEGCLEHAEEISRKSYRESLLQHQDQARMSRELARIQLDVAIDWDPDRFARREPRRAEARVFFTEMGFSKIVEELEETEDLAPGPEPVRLEADQPVERLCTSDELRHLTGELSKRPMVALVPVFSSPEPMRAELLGLGLAASGGRVVFAPTRRGAPAAPGGLEEKDFIAALRPMLADPEVGKVAEDLKQLQVFLLRHGARMEGLDLDTTVAAYLLDPERREYGLSSLETTYLGRLDRPAPARKRVPEGDTQPISPVPEVAREAGRKCRVLLDLSDPIRHRLRDASLEKLYREIEAPLLSILAEMEWNGVRLDVAFLEELADQWKKDLLDLEQRIYALAGERFNIQSPRQLREVLFGKLGLTPGRKTEKEKSFSTGMDVLDDLAGEHPLPATILEYRSLAKLQSTYVEALPRLVHPDTGRVHACFNQAAAATGRLSSRNPNLQNIPIRSEAGRRIRRAFVAEEGWRILTADYSQIELRVLAHLGRDEEMIRAFRSGEDIHARTAAQVFGVAPGLVTPDLRRQAKAINFGIIYGMGPFRLARELGVSSAVARKFIEGYLERFAGVKRYVDEVVARTEREGSVSTLFGRIRPVPEIRSRNANLRNQGIRVAVNTTIQGTAADLIKMAMIQLDRRLKADGRRSRLLIQVHDELLLEVPEDEVPEASRLVREAMEGCHPLEVPLLAEVRVGPNWLETRPVKG